jgi:uncharacterized protein (DUF302 family)
MVSKHGFPDPILMLVRHMTQNFRFSHQAKDRSRGVLAVLGVCMGACLPIAIGWKGQSHSGFSQLARAEDRMALDGLKTIPSHFGTKETIDRLEAEIKAKGLTVFARIDHAAGAAAIGMSLRPTELLIFGNARGGTPLMQADQRIGIDLPLKGLAYQDDAGKVWFAYNDLHWLAQRYGLESAVAANVETLSKALDALASGAAKAE